MAEQGAAERLWEMCADVAGRCLEHPFVQALRDGTLPRETYAAYIAQDAFFLDVFARGYALGVAKAPDRATMRAFHELQSGVFDEQRLHEQVAAREAIDLAAVVPRPATSAYTDFLTATAFTGSIGEILAAMAPCMRLYRFLGTALAAAPAGAEYQEWVDAYAGEEFGRLVATIEALVDRFCEGTPREALAYRRAMELEHAFFEQMLDSS